MRSLTFVISKRRNTREGTRRITQLHSSYDLAFSVFLRLSSWFSLRMKELAEGVLNGGFDPGAGRAEKGAAAIAGKIQQLVTMNPTRY
jgi:hypothetical protein